MHTGTQTNKQACAHINAHKKLNAQKKKNFIQIHFLPGVLEREPRAVCMLDNYSAVMTLVSIYLI